jgi:uncharacterized protein YndB with AHSA1/START domain
MSEEFRPVHVEVQIPAAASSVFAALTDSRALEAWFAEKADVSLEEKRYDFWGRFTPENPDREAGRHKLVQVERDRRLVFEWRLRDHGSTVEMELSQSGSDTLAVVRQSVLAWRQSQASIANFWAFSLENLRSWIMRKRIGLRCDFSTGSPDPVKMSIDVDAPPEGVFEALIKPEQLDRYIATKAVVEPRVGGRYDFGWGSCPVKILELEPNRKLAYSWEYKDQPPTVVTWTLNGSGGRTRITLVHSGFGPKRDNQDYRAGWIEFLNALKFMCEVGPSWKKVRTVKEDYVMA